MDSIIVTFVPVNMESKFLRRSVQSFRIRQQADKTKSRQQDFLVNHIFVKLCRSCHPREIVKNLFIFVCFHFSHKTFMRLCNLITDQFFTFTRENILVVSYQFKKKLSMRNIL